MGASSISALRMEKSRVPFGIPKVTNGPGFKSESHPGKTRAVSLSLGGSRFPFRSSVLWVMWAPGLGPCFYLFRLLGAHVPPAQ